MRVNLFHVSSGFLSNWAPERNSAGLNENPAIGVGFRVFTSFDAKATRNFCGGVRCGGNDPGALYCRIGA